MKLIKTIILSLSLILPLFGQGSYYFASFRPSNIKHPNFHKVGQAYGAGFVELWVKAKTPQILGYLVSDGAGGQHDILFGIATDDDSARLTGNFYTGQGFFNFDSTTSFKLNEWAHVAWGYDGTKVMLWVNGVKVFQQPYSGTRMTLPGGSDGNLYIGGSYHNNPGANIARVRILEGFCPYTEDFVPDRVFSQLIRVHDGEFYKASFVADYSAPAEAFPDLGIGLTEYEGRGRIRGLVTHPGVLNGYTPETDLPVWQNDRVSYSSGKFTPPPVPENALAFDSFTRANQTKSFQSIVSLGQSEGGSLGVLNWDAPDGWGILSEYAYCIYNSWYTNHLEIGRADVDVRVTRLPGTGTGLDLRYIDDANHLVVSGNDASIGAIVFLGGVASYFQFNAPSGWQTLRAVASGSVLKVYADGVQVGTVPIPPGLSGTKHGLFYGGTINRYKNFTVYPVN